MRGSAIEIEYFSICFWLSVSEARSQELHPDSPRGLHGSQNLWPSSAALEKHINRIGSAAAEIQTSTCTDASLIYSVLPSTQHLQKKR